MSILFKAFKATPIQVQNIDITIVSNNSYRIRHGKNYKKYKNYYKKWEESNKVQLEQEVKRRFSDFLKYSQGNSKWFKNKITDEMIKTLNIQSLPILEKSDIVNHFDEIRTVERKGSIVNQSW